MDDFNNHRLPFLDVIPRNNPLVVQCSACVQQMGLRSFGEPP